MLNADAQLLIFILIAHIHFLADFQHSCTLLISISNMIQKMVVYADADSHVWACVTEPCSDIASYNKLVHSLCHQHHQPFGPVNCQGDTQ